MNNLPINAKKDLKLKKQLNSKNDSKLNYSAPN